VNGKKIASIRDFYRLVNDRSAKEMAFTVVRDGNTIKTLAYVKK